MKKIKPDGSKTLYVAGIYEVDKNSTGTVTGTKTYYPAAGAMRVGSTLYYMLKDHLGSASVVTDSTGTIVGEDRFYPFGETRFTTGTMQTDKLFTGQREVTGLGIYYYGARFYSPYINRFLSADTIVPGYVNPQNLNRYSYVTNNPLRYKDPSGHKPCEEYAGTCLSENQVTQVWNNTHNDHKQNDKHNDQNGCDTLKLGPKACDTAIDILKGTTIVADALGLGVSFIEWTFVGPPLIGGLFVGGLMAIFEPEILLGAPAAIADFLVYDAGVATMFAPLENNLALVSLGTTFAADWLEGNNSISEGNIYVGTATMVSASTFAAGLIPEANIDLAASVTQFAVDLSPTIPPGSVNVSQLIENLFH